MNSQLSGRRVLLVEDEGMIAWLLSDMLVMLGCRVVGPAARVDQALAIIELDVFDAAVLDLNLGGQLSYPVADALTARGIPFVISTGYGRESLLSNYRDLPLLQKPYRRIELSHVLAKLLTPETTFAEKATISSVR